MSKRTNWTNSRDLIRAAFLLPIGIVLAATTALQAQPVSFTGVQSTILGSGLRFPTGVAANAAGEVFITDYLNNRVLKVSPTGVQTEVATGLNLPQGLALDGSGNLFIADTFNDRVLKFSTSGVLTTVVSGLNRPMGVAVDLSNRLYIADAYNDRVVKVASGTQTVVASGLNRPAGVALDLTGNVFIADTGNNRVIKIATDGVQSLVTQYVAQPYSLATDSAGNLFIADTNDARVVKIAPNGTMTTINNTVSYPYAVAVDDAGSIFIADSNHDRVIQQQLTAVNFGNLNVCPAGQSNLGPCSRTYTLNYHLNNTVTFGSPTVYTQGGSNLDFKLNSSSCTGTVVAGGSCTATVTFTPLAPGARLGGFELIEAAPGGKVLASTPVYGQGQGAAMSFGPGSPVAVASGLVSGSGLAVDGAGNIIIADFLGNRVLRVSPGGAQTAVGAGLRFPSGVAVDGAGNVFIADTGNGRVIKVQARDGEQTIVAGGLSLPPSVAVDGAGNLFIADYGNNRVIRIAAASGLQTIVGSAIGLHLPYGVAVDGAGTVYIADYGNNRVVKVSSKGAFESVADKLNFPTAVAVNAAGTVFVADTFNDRVLEIPAHGPPPIPVLTGLGRPQGVAVDGAGNIYISDSDNHRVLNVQRSTPPAFVFAPTLVKGTSSSQIVTIASIGNQQLSAVAPGLTIGDGFRLGRDGTPPNCNPGFNLRPGERCDLSINFVPQTVGSFQSAAVLTDNALNGAPATQTIILSGTSPATTTSVQAASGTYSDPVTLTAGVTLSAGLSFAGSLQFFVDEAPACSVAVTGSGTYRCGFIISQVSGSHSLTANLTSSDPKVQGSTGVNTLTVAAEDAIIVPLSTTVTGDQYTDDVTLTAALAEVDDGSPGNLRNIRTPVASVTLQGRPSYYTCDASYGDGGLLTAHCVNVPWGLYAVIWELHGGGYYQAPKAHYSFNVHP